MNERTSHSEEAGSLDAALEEIHAIRRRLWDEAGHDVAAYIERSRERAERRQVQRSDDQTQAA